jgi:5-formyltetrahydrofolate cyclo-ligase
MAAAKPELRQIFRHRRSVIPYDLRSTTQWKVINHLRSLMADLRPTVVALYYAQNGEINLEPLAQELWRDGQTVALPRVAARGQPLVFNIWPPFGALEADLSGMAAATGPEILPSLMVVPMLGYSKMGDRLGYGGGYYDRTLAALRHPCRTVGVCYTELELPAEFVPAAHDRRLDYVVTGKEIITPPHIALPQIKPAKFVTPPAKVRRAAVAKPRRKR